MAREYGTLGDEKQGFQKLANDKARAEVLKEFSSEMESYDSKRLPPGRKKVDEVYVAPKQDIKEEEPTPLDFDERLRKFLRD